MKDARKKGTSYGIKAGTVLMLYGYVREMPVRAQVDKIIPFDGTVKYEMTVHDGPKDRRGPLSLLASQLSITGKTARLEARV